MAAIYLLERDTNGNPIIDATGSKYKLKKIENTSGIVQPTLGIIVEFTSKRKSGN